MSALYDTRLPHLTTKANVARVLARTGYPAGMIDEVLMQLHDPIDSLQAAQVFNQYGITLGVLMDQLGASP